MTWRLGATCGHKQKGGAGKGEKRWKQDTLWQYSPDHSFRIACVQTSLGCMPCFMIGRQRRKMAYQDLAGQLPAQEESAGSAGWCGIFQHAAMQLPPLQGFLCREK